MTLTDWLSRILQLAYCFASGSQTYYVCRIFLLETGYLFSLYINNFVIYFIYNFIISFNFHGNFNIFLRNIWEYLGFPWSLGRGFLWRRLRLAAESSILDFGVVLATFLDIICLYVYVFYDRYIWSIYRTCKYDLGNLILLQNKSDNNEKNNSRACILE